MLYQSAGSDIVGWGDPATATEVSGWCCLSIDVERFPELPRRRARRAGLLRLTVEMSVHNQSRPVVKNWTTRAGRHSPRGRVLLTRHIVLVTVHRLLALRRQLGLPFSLSRFGSLHRVLLVCFNLGRTGRVVFGWFYMSGYVNRGIEGPFC
jgi:hypothetical protein